MRARLLFVLAALGVSSVACGLSKRPVYDPSEAKSAKAEDDVPKWEGAAPREDPKPKSAEPTVHEAPARRTDQYDKPATEVVLNRAARQVKENCGAASDETGKATGPWGKATVQVQLGHNGHSKGVMVPQPYAGQATGNCVEKAFSNLTFPPWAGSDTTVEWEVELIEPKPVKAPDKKKK